MAQQLNLPGIPGSGGIGGALQGLLGSQAVRSIAEWMMLQQLIQSALAPLIAEIEQTTFGQFPTLVSSPVELAAGVVRGHIPQDTGFAEARKSGYDKSPFQLLLDNAGQPLPLQTLTEAWRRGVIPEAGTGAESISLEQGIRESDLKNKWIPTVKALQWLLLSPGDVVAAWVRSQIPEAEARDRLRKAGIDTPEQTVLYNTTGRPPSPQELADLAHRGVIPWEGTGPDVLSVKQGIYEGDTKNKWFPVYQALTAYLPPPRTVTAMVREGALGDDEALALFKKAGLDPQLAGQYLAAAHHQKTAASRELAKSDILALYTDRLIDAVTATALLDALGYSAQDAAWELAIAGFRANRALQAQAVTRLRTLYVARKLDKTAVTSTLADLKISTDAINLYLQTWDLERLNQVQRLTATEWADAAKESIVTPDEAIAQLQALGFSPYEAWVRVALVMKDAKLPNMPTPEIPAGYAVGP